MPEYRHNLITDNWVIIASERGTRPFDFARPGSSVDSEYEEKCPFCPGHEHTTPPETYAHRPNETQADTEGWSLRVVPNKFPFLAPGQGAGGCEEDFHSKWADGHHEVLIESPHHSRHFAKLHVDQACDVIKGLRARYRYHQSRQGIRHVSIFKNHGRSAGASLAHPHFQIAASSLLPSSVSRYFQYCTDYFDRQEISPFESVLKKELTSGKRLISQNDDFVAFCPFASQCPFEVYVVAKMAVLEIGAFTDKMVNNLSEILQGVLVRLCDGLNNPDYNLIFHNAPICDASDVQGFRFYLQIYPRLTTIGGYELATSTFINTIAPETAASFYRDEQDNC